MKTESSYQFQVYEISEQELRIHWNIEQKTKKDDEGNITIYWQANEALCNKLDDRSTLIQKIIGSVYKVADEIATINNAEIKPEQYTEYQAFRTQAKALADGWVNKE